MTANQTPALRLQEKKKHFHPGRTLRNESRRDYATYLPRELFQRVLRRLEAEIHPECVTHTGSGV